MSEIGEMVVWRTARGLARYQIEVWHHGLHRYQMIRADSSAVLASRARALAAQWDELCHDPPSVWACWMGRIGW
ncbi:MAG: hypothetical protein FJX72_00135 [Armatimonadetes bacterium]|nr:hypothetical protein [Armatimonadota bacterium]